MAMDLEQQRYVDFAGARALLPSRRRRRGAHVGGDLRLRGARDAPATRATSASRSSSPTSSATSARTRAAAASTCRRTSSRASASPPSAILRRARSAGVRRADGVPGRARARAGTTRALAQLPAADRTAQRAGLVMAAIYRTLLDEIARDGYRVLDRRIALTPLRKLWIAWRTRERPDHDAGPSERCAGPPVAVIGGGWAGCAAAVDAREPRRTRVTVFEAARVLGGRARRVERDGLPLDNGQHLLLGAYEATRCAARERARRPCRRRPRPAAARDRAVRARCRRRTRCGRCASAPPGPRRAGSRSRTGLGLGERVAALRWLKALREAGSCAPVPNRRCDARVRCRRASHAVAVGAAALAALNTPPDAGLGAGVRQCAARGVRRGPRRCRLPAAGDRPVRALSGAAARAASKPRGGEVRTGVRPRLVAPRRIDGVDRGHAKRWNRARSPRRSSRSARTSSRTCSRRAWRRSRTCADALEATPRFATSRSAPSSCGYAAACRAAVADRAARRCARANGSSTGPTCSSARRTPRRRARSGALVVVVITRRRARRAWTPDASRARSMRSCGGWRRPCRRRLVAGDRRAARDLRVHARAARGRAPAASVRGCVSPATTSTRSSPRRSKRRSRAARLLGRDHNAQLAKASTAARVPGRSRSAQQIPSPARAARTSGSCRSRSSAAARTRRACGTLKCARCSRHHAMMLRRRDGRRARLQRDERAGRLAPVRVRPARRRPPPSPADAGRGTPRPRARRCSRRRR